ncbi:hypothetical protein ONZ45_g381 [Pleurotus djamor]|nr:hypothetical protein ONZ45_g381 [Pleurotus djamor]
MATPLRDSKKDVLKPNPHPYAIKTTSTALLSRSNSSSQSARPVHSYIPSPSPSPTRTRVGHRQFGYGHLHGHRYSRSLTSESPRPLPVPPSPSPTKQLGHGHSPSFDVDLPANPKLWTPSQLATYLATALRVRSGESLQLPTPVARDIAAFVRNSKITGKEFLRFNEQDLNNYGINKLWSSALLAASRTLRQNVLKGRIWGFGSTDFEGASTEDITTTNPFIEHIQYDSASSTSSLDIDRSYSDNEFFDVTFQSNAKHVVLDDDDTPVKGHRRGRPSLGKLKNGRVRGMVESLERSASVDESMDKLPRSRTGSDSSEGPLHPTIRPQQTGTTTFHTRPSESEQYLPSSYQTSEPAQSEAGTTDIYDTATEGGDEAENSPTSAAPPVSSFAAEEELSMEELLAQIDAEKASGAHAWEREVNTHGTAIITMKHVPPSHSPLDRVPTGSTTSNDSIKGRPLPAPPASGSPVIYLPANQTPSHPANTHHTGGAHSRPLPTPGSAGTLSPRIHAPTPRHGSLRGLGASWNAIDADGVVARLSGSVESLVSASGDGAAPSKSNPTTEGHSHDASFEGSGSWIQPSRTGSDGLPDSVNSPLNGKEKDKLSKRRIRLSGSGGGSRGSSLRTNVSRKSSGQSRRPAISDIFGGPEEEDVGVGERRQAPPTQEQLEETMALLTAERARVEGHEAEKAAWSSREKVLERELEDAKKLIEEYRMKLEKSEKEVVELREMRQRDQDLLDAASPTTSAGPSSQVPVPKKSDVGGGLGLGLLLGLMPQAVLGRVLGSQGVSYDNSDARTRPSSSHRSSSSGKDDIELGQSEDASPSPLSSPSSSRGRQPTSRTWKDLIPTTIYNQWMGTSEPEQSDRRAHVWGDPATIRGLPPYVLLVGLGVAAVVLRVVLRRVGYRLGLGVGMRR